MMRLLRFVLFALLLLPAWLAWPQSFVPVPSLQARVTDMAGMLSEQQRSALENVLRDHEARTGSQIAVLLMKSTAPEAIEQYSIRVADAWKLGRKGVDDGVILLVARDNPPALRRLRIEAGRGVQGSLTDAQSRRIIDDVIAPHFRLGDYYGGLSAGVSAISTLLDKEQLPPAQRRANSQAENGISLLPLLFFGFIGLMMMVRAGRARRGLGYGNWDSGRGAAAGVILGNALGHAQGGSYGGGDFGGSGGFSGGGGTFDGGGASGNW